MKMKRKSIALLLALIMCLSLLSACGADKTEEAAAPESAVDTAGQQEVVKEEEPEPEQEVPEETEEPEEAAEPEQEEVEEQNNAGTEFLALLQEEYENGFFQGEGPRHTYYVANEPFIYNGVVYLIDDGTMLGNWGGFNYYGTYDIASKTYNESDIHNEYKPGLVYFIDDNFYYSGYSRSDDRVLEMYDCNGTCLNSGQYYARLRPCDKGLFCWEPENPVFLSYNLEKIAEIAIPQREIEHGLEEDMEPKDYINADGAMYAEFDGDDSLYRLNTDTYEWENTGNAAPASINGDPFFGKYFSRNDGIYDIVTGERVFEYGELYCGATKLCYFGGDKYLGYNGSEYRWVNLTDLSMSDPLPFPKEDYFAFAILNDTYCVYQDEYGWFLWNYNDGSEETIVMFDN